MLEVYEGHLGVIRFLRMDLNWYKRQFQWNIRAVLP